MRREGEYALDNYGDSPGHMASLFQLSYRRWPDPPSVGCGAGRPDFQPGNRTPAARAQFMKLLLWILQFAFGCHHSQLSRVFTIKKRTYQVCVECGREFEYSWESMHSSQSSVADNACAPLNTARQAEVSAI
jgi:hypothetical protein